MTVLADAVGEHGKVVAVDPASLDYGAFCSRSPYFLVKELQAVD